LHVYEVRPRKDRRGVDLICDALPFGRLWYGEPNAISNAIGYAKHRSRSHDAVIRVYDAAGNVIETHEHAGDLKQWQPFVCHLRLKTWLRIVKTAAVNITLA
jgi:hypothetical protein